MIKYEFTPKDLAAFNNYYMRHKAPFLVKYLRYLPLVIAVGFIINLGTIFFAKKQFGEEANVDVLPLIVVAGVLLVLFFRKKKLTASAVDHFAKKNPNAFGHQEITLSEDKLIIEKAGEKSEFIYNNAIGLAEDTDHYYIFKTTNTALVIPKAAVIEVADLELLKNKLKAYQ